IAVFEKEFGELPASCYNNVFNPIKGEKALIVVEVPKQAYVRLNLYNTRGNKIIELANEQKEAGTHKYYWDGKSGNGNVVGSGLYFVHIQAGDYKKTKKIVVVK
ncbi:T9SS type A sorting domain-containing protein, partial [bacterium]|nr:T9SS type A sorting domain-containing protein [bacterium]NIN91657.1 T9SS type A sorting domain-containing protein [bacterium]NIO18008.1 T9SS type A sorting domain-containing protein [bacterium]NIO72972.1 T9SS type A sorting domain-containing protein [bacterium]